MKYYKKRLAEIQAENERRHEAWLVANPPVPRKVKPRSEKQLANDQRLREAMRVRFCVSTVLSDR